MRTETILVAGAAAILAAPAHAATRCVNPTGAGGCTTTIQAAVDASAPGDRITVGAGTYFENVVVPAGKDGLQIVGAGRAATILDPDHYTDRGIFHSGPGLDISAARVQVRGLTVRNGRVESIAVRASGVVIQAVHLTGAQGGGVVIHPPAVGVQVVQCEVSETTQGVVALTGTQSPVVKSSRFRRAHTAVLLRADSALVDGNRIALARTGVLVDAHDAIVRRNEVRTVLDSGISVTGDRPRVERNRIFNAGVTGVSIRCMICQDGSVSNNSVTDSGFQGVWATGGPGLLLQGNRVLRALQGVVIVGPGFQVVANRVTDVGHSFLSSACLDVTGASNVVRGNTASRCAVGGVRVDGDGNVVERNVVSNTFGNGVAVSSGSGVMLVNNRVSDNAGQGIAIYSATNATVTGNTAGRNRLDFCDQGTATTVSGNTFGTTGATCPLSY